MTCRNAFPALACLVPFLKESVAVRLVERVYLTNLWLENNAFALILGGFPVLAPASLAGLEAYRRSGLSERVGSDGLGAGPVHGHVGAVAGELGEIEEARPVAGR